MEGEWDTDDLTTLLRVIGSNMEEINRRGLVTSALGVASNRIRHFLHRNTLFGSRSNIAYHYDLGNDFYRLFLDETMTYSSALFADEGQDLAGAQRNKIRHLLDRVPAAPGDHLLEIGSGWGELSLIAARERGCRVTTITLSREQLRIVRQRVREAGLQERIKPMLCDYRRLKGQFDKVVSVEMIEAVGHEFLGTYFHSIDRLLKPGGLAGIQAITIPDHRYERYRSHPDWIQKYIFPGAVVPSISAMTGAMARDSKLVLEELYNFPLHYAKTLRLWRQGFEQNIGKARELGFDDRFLRMWRYYLCYCEAGFAERLLGVAHLTLSRQGNHQLPANPAAWTSR